MDLSQRPLQLAVALARTGVEVTVVGGLARRLHGADHRPRDLDVVVDPTGVPALLAALETLGVVTPPRLRTCTTLATSWGPLDVFVASHPPREALISEGQVLQVAR
jgi:NADPH-dependent ferric siderophore reductase